jgi:hypothetical protein
MKLLDSKISQGSQDYTLTQLYIATYEYTSGAIKQSVRQKLRITIKSDSYEQQCFARISIYSPEERKWNRLASIEPSVMKTEKGLCYKHEAPTEYNFQNDINELMRLADLILA